MATKQYIVTTPDGEEIEVFNLHKFCRDNGLNSGKMYLVVTGYRKRHKGYKARHKE